MGQINFDAQRAEAGLTGHEITVGDRTVALPPILSLEFGVAMDNRDLEAAITVLVGEPDDDGEIVADPAVVRHLLRHLSVDDLSQIGEELYDLSDGDEEPVPNREARRAGAKAKRKAAGAKG